MSIIENSISLDWLSFTVPYSGEAVEQIEQSFDLVDVPANGFGGNGYIESKWILDGGRILWHPDRPEMGVHVILPAKSLALVSFTSLGLLTRARDWGAKVTRLDLAFDDFGGILNIDTIFGCLKSGDVVTRFKKFSRVEGMQAGVPERIGHTVNVGSRSSNSYIRIYDKLAEQLSKNQDVTGIDSWTRVEIELKKERANAMSDLLAGCAEGLSDVSPGTLCASVLLGLIDFKIRNYEDENKSRWATTAWWHEFVGSVEKKSLSKAREQKTVERSKMWVRNQVATTLTIILLSETDVDEETGYDFIMQCAKDGEKKLQPHHRKMIESYNKRVKARKCKYGGK